MTEDYDNLYGPDPANDPPSEPGGEPAPEQAPAAQPPDIGEAVAQMREQMNRIEERTAQQEQQPYEPEPYYDDGGGYDDYGGLLDPGVGDDLEQLVDERVAQRVEPYLQAQQDEADAQAIRAYVEKHPDLTNEETLDAVDDELLAISEATGIDVRTDPAMVERAHQIVLARQSLAGGEPAEQQQQRQQVHLETNAGARPAPSPQHPTDAAILGALTGNAPKMQDEDLYG